MTVSHSREKKKTEKLQWLYIFKAQRGGLKHVACQFILYSPLTPLIPITEHCQALCPVFKCIR